MYLLMKSLMTALGAERLSIFLKKVLSLLMQAEAEISAAQALVAICKHIIGSHAPTIHASIKPDIGTTIGFTL